MRIVKILFVTSILVSGDPCKDLCSRDGRTICTKGSWTDRGVCFGYLFKNDPATGEYCYHTPETAASCPSTGIPVTPAHALILLGASAPQTTPGPVQTERSRPGPPMRTAVIPTGLRNRYTPDLGIPIPLPTSHVGYPWGVKMSSSDPDVLEISGGPWRSTTRSIRLPYITAHGKRPESVVESASRIVGENYSNKASTMTLLGDLSLVRSFLINPSAKVVAATRRETRDDTIYAVACLNGPTGAHIGSAYLTITPRETVDFPEDWAARICSMLFTLRHDILLGA